MEDLVMSDLQGIESEVRALQHQSTKVFAANWQHKGNGKFVAVFAPIDGSCGCFTQFVHTQFFVPFVRAVISQIEGELAVMDYSITLTPGCDSVGPWGPNEELLGGWLRHAFYYTNPNPNPDPNHNHNPNPKLKTTCDHTYP